MKKVQKKNLKMKSTNLQADENEMVCFLLNSKDNVT